ncbi:MAG: hypothetical protein NTW87_24785 [Planctomycetota bacterium]|nr:hypothetical protein [Planctomycetota bacterium]
MANQNSSPLPIGAAREADEHLYRRLVTLLPSSSGALYFLKEWNMAFRFQEERLRPLDEFTNTWDDAEHWFLDVEIEAKRRVLLTACKKYLLWIGLNTAPAEHCVPGLQEITPYCDIAEDPGWKEYEKKVGEVHCIAEEIVGAHQDFVIAARRRLQISTQPIKSMQVGPVILPNAKNVVIGVQHGAPGENLGAADAQEMERGKTLEEVAGLLQALIDKKKVGDGCLYLMTDIHSLLKKIDSSHDIGKTDRNDFERIRRDFVAMARMTNGEQTAQKLLEIIQRALKKST